LHPVFPAVDTEMPIWVSGFCPFFQSGLTSFFDAILCFLVCCSLLTYYEIQHFSGGQILYISTKITLDC
jgi:hypothetical protein